MAEAQAACAICDTRRPRRYCPGVTGHICPVCCGTERENTVNCPLDCPYLREARKREPDRIQVGPAFESFLRENEPLFAVLGGTLARAALDNGAIDSDVREALEALVGTYKTLQSGLVYHQRPNNPIAGRVQFAVEDVLKKLEQSLTKHGSKLRDADLLAGLTFLQTFETQKNNGRPKSRAFVQFLVEMFPFEPPQADPEPNLIIL